MRGSDYVADMSMRASSPTHSYRAQVRKRTALKDFWAKFCTTMFAVTLERPSVLLLPVLLISGIHIRLGKPGPKIMSVNMSS